MKAFVVFLSAVAIAHCVPVAKDVSVLKSVFDNVMNCAGSEVNLCLKEQALKATERLGTVRKLNLIDGVTIFNHGTAKEGRSLDILSEDPEVRKQQVTEKLWENASELLQNSELEVSFGGDDDESSRALSDSEEGRGKKKGNKKKLKMLMPLAILAKAKAIAIIVFALVVIAASLFKLAVIAKIAFLAKLATILKSLLAKKQDDHGWAPQAQEEHGHGWESSGGWSRSRNEANNLAYAAYRK